MKVFPSEESVVVAGARGAGRRLPPFRWGGDAEGGAPFVEADPNNPAIVRGFDVEVAEQIAKDWDGDRNCASAVLRDRSVGGARRLRDRHERRRRHSPRRAEHAATSRTSNFTKC